MLVEIKPDSIGLDPAIQRTMELKYYTYILASKKNGALYIGVTNNLARRVFEHKQGSASQFTIQRETNLKRWPRKWKLDLIEKDNPEWIDLFDTLA